MILSIRNTIIDKTVKNITGDLKLKDSENRQGINFETFYLIVDHLEVKTNILTSVQKSKQ